MQTIQVLSRPNGIFKSVTEHRGAQSLDVDIEFSSGLKLHEEMGQDLVVISDGVAKTWQGAHLDTTHGGRNFLLPRDGAPGSDISISGPVQNDGHGHYTQTLQIQAANGEAKLLFCTGDSPEPGADIGVNIRPDGSAELWGTKSGEGHVTADGSAVLATDSFEKREYNLPFLLAPTSLGHRYP